MVCFVKGKVSNVTDLWFGFLFSFFTQLYRQMNYCSSNCGKKLMVVLIEGCPSTQCIAVCCVWGCLAV